MDERVLCGPISPAMEPPDHRIPGTAEYAPIVVLLPQAERQMRYGALIRTASHAVKRDDSVMGVRHPRRRGLVLG